MGKESAQRKKSLDPQGYMKEKQIINRYNYFLFKGLQAATILSDQDSSLENELNRLDDSLKNLKGKILYHCSRIILTRTTEITSY